MLALRLGQSIGAGNSPVGFSNLYSLRFAGVDDYVNLNSASSVIDVTKGAISVWAKLDVVSDNTPIFKFYTNSNNQATIIYLHSSKEFKFMYKAAGTNTQVITSAGSIEGDGNFHHFAMTWDVSASRFFAYLNGSQVGTTQTTFGTWSGTPSVFELGRNGLSGTGYWIGYMDEIAIFDEAQSTLEIATIYNSGVPTDLSGENDLVGYWRNEEGSGTTIADGSTNSNSGTLVNGTAFSTDVP
mgnify:CR=1 FL=1